LPPLRKYNREDIIKVAYEIAKLEGLEGINARKIAKTLGSSVQPIFHNFKNMEELIGEVTKKIYLKYQEYFKVDVKMPKAYKLMGLGYIKFARDYPEFFKILFMKQTNKSAIDFVMADALSDDVIKAGVKLTGFSVEDQKRFHVKVWIFTHGMACLMATKTVNFTDLELDELLTDSIVAMYRGEGK